jgi:hypothetical protein
MPADIQPVSTVGDALEYFAGIGETILSANRAWQRRGFDYYAPTACQMLSAADLIEYANNSQEIELPNRPLRGERIA